jgi:hypothetical protein
VSFSLCQFGKFAVLQLKRCILLLLFLSPQLTANDQRMGPIPSHTHTVKLQKHEEKQDTSDEMSSAACGNRNGNKSALLSVIPSL